MGRSVSDVQLPEGLAKERGSTCGSLISTYSKMGFSVLGVLRALKWHRHNKLLGHTVGHKQVRGEKGKNSDQLLGKPNAPN